MEEEISQLKNELYKRLDNSEGYYTAALEVAGELIEKAYNLGMKKGESYQAMSNDINNSKVY